MVRIKHRYLLVNFLYPADSAKLHGPGRGELPGLLQIHQPTPDRFHPGVLLAAIREGVLELFGEYGSGMVNDGLKVNYLSNATSTAIIRCSRSHYQMVWAVLTLMTELPDPIGIPVVVKVARVSGTIRKAEEEVIRRAKNLIERAKVSGTDQERVNGMIKAAERKREVLVEVDRESGRESESE